MRFLFKWQHVDPTDRLTGIDGLREALAALDGFELAGSAWERAVLPARVDGYEPSMLDMLCLAGEVAWGRLSSGVAAVGVVTHLVPATPIALFQRAHAEAWQTLAARDGALEETLDEPTVRVLAVLRQRGASFLNDLSSATGLDRDATRKAIGTLVACGLATSDGFSGLRSLLSLDQGQPGAPTLRAHFTGRWSAVGSGTLEREQAVETQAWALLRRYGVVFRRLLTRDSPSIAWRELTRVYRRLEARGEIRGGRFVAGMSGEQFALPDAVTRLREVRRSKPDGQIITISAADPLNLVGIITPGDRIRPAPRRKLTYQDGALKGTATFAAKGDSHILASV
jgi:ATP-dependent helicase Lhr and Lhr-like helicase